MANIKTIWIAVSLAMEGCLSKNKPINKRTLSRFAHQYGNRFPKKDIDAILKCINVEKINQLILPRRKIEI